MVNAWSLLYDELYGDDKMSESLGEDVYVDSLPKDYDKRINKTSAYNDGWTQEHYGDFFTLDDYVSADRSQTGNFEAADTVSFNFSSGEDAVIFSGDSWDDGSNYIFPHLNFEDHIDLSVGAGNTAYDDPKYYATKPQPNLKYKQQKYGEDKGIADLKDYVSSTYQGHYTNDSSDVQTLDLIHSVGDAESFCRSNALKYLSRYDKKGQAKRDILKAMHYCLLLYYFSGNTNNETPTRGYETF